MTSRPTKDAVYILVVAIAAVGMMRSVWGSILSSPSWKSDERVVAQSHLAEMTHGLAVKSNDITWELLPNSWKRPL